jgi:hypothetical protein
MRNAGPILNASARLVGELLQDRLAPLVRELMASIVRFEWYFQPLLVPEKGRNIVLGGLATTQPELDARLVLNAAERTALESLGSWRCTFFSQLSAGKCSSSMIPRRCSTPQIRPG